MQAARRLRATRCVRKKGHVTAHGITCCVACSYGNARTTQSVYRATPPYVLPPSLSQALAEIVSRATAAAVQTLHSPEGQRVLQSSPLSASRCVLTRRPEQIHPLRVIWLRISTSSLLSFLPPCAQGGHQPHRSSTGSRSSSAARGRRPGLARAGG